MVGTRPYAATSGFLQQSRLLFVGGSGSRVGVRLEGDWGLKKTQKMKLEKTGSLGGSTMEINGGSP